MASLYRRNSLLEIIEKTAKKIFIPLTVAGGIRSVEDIRIILRAGADKVAINTAAVENPRLLSESSKIFGSQCIVSSIEAHPKGNGEYEVWVDYGRERTGIDVFEWAKRVEGLGAGEILLTSIHRAGMGKGYDIELAHRVSSSLSIPVIACGGAGKASDLARVVTDGKADGVTAASLFHYFYALPKDGHTLQYKKKELRMGQ